MRKLRRNIVSADDFLERVENLSKTNKKSAEKRAEFQKAKTDKVEQRTLKREPITYTKLIIGLFILLVITFSGIVKIYNISKEIIAPAINIINFDQHDKIKEIMFEGQPWLVLCSNHPMSSQYKEILKRSSAQITKHSQIATLDCNGTLPSGKAFYERFSLHPSSLGFIVSNSDRPKQISYDDFKNETRLVKIAQTQSKLALKELTGINQFTKSCVDSKNSCILIGSKQKSSTYTENKKFLKSLKKYRKLKTFIIDTNKYQMKFDNVTKALFSSTPSKNEKGSRIFCLTSMKGNETSQKQYYGAYFDDYPSDTKKLEEFFQICSDVNNHRDDERFKLLNSPPRIKLKPPTTKYTPPPSNYSSNTPPPSPSNVDNRMPSDTPYDISNFNLSDFDFPDEDEINIW